MFKAKTTVSVDGEKVLINNLPTYQGTSVEGQLFNVRTVNATFDDTLGKVDWWDDDGHHPENGCAGYGKWIPGQSAAANTQRFIDSLTDYKAHGILAVNLNFQGGRPLAGKTGIEGLDPNDSANSPANGHRDFYHNSGFNPDGSIDPDHGQRIADVIEACDALGMAVILQFFYFGQDTALEDEAAVFRAVEAGADFVCQRGYTNCLIEIANEVSEWHFHHDALKPGRVAELVRCAKARAHDAHSRDLLVSTSECSMMTRDQWTDQQIADVFGTSDFILCHGGDNIDAGKVGDVSEVANKIDYLREQDWFAAAPKPIIFNESDGEQAFEAALKRNVSFGLFRPNSQTFWPPKWGTWEPAYRWYFEKTTALAGGA